MNDLASCILALGEQLGYPYFTFPCDCVDSEGEWIRGLDAWAAGKRAWKNRCRQPEKPEEQPAHRKELETVYPVIKALSQEASDSLRDAQEIDEEKESD